MLPQQRDTEVTVYAAEASDNNDLLERSLPATISDYVELVKAHLAAGPNYRFTCQQLLLLGIMLDFSDTTNRKVASAFVHELLHRPLEHEVYEDGEKVIIGEGINHGGDREWATGVSELAKKVHASIGEFKEVVLAVLEELAEPCRERTSDFMQWMHCFAVVGLLVDNVKSLRCLQGRGIEPAEILHSLLLPGAKHVHLDVQRVALRCLGLYGLLERKPSEDLVKQLIFSLINYPSPVSIMASKALVDLGMWHGPQEVDLVTGINISARAVDDKKSFPAVNLSHTNENLNVKLLDLLFAVLARDLSCDPSEIYDWESIQAILGEGFAKILLFSENYPSIPASLQHELLAELIKLYFSDEGEDLQRLKQCLSVFFEDYSALTVVHKRCISKAFIPVVRSMWPAIYGNARGSSFVVSNLRKRATQASRFMLEATQVPLYLKEPRAEKKSALARFANAVENCDIIDPFLLAVPLKEIAEVCKNIILSLHCTNATSTTIIDCTPDVSESVRKAAYHVLANKSPLQSFRVSNPVADQLFEHGTSIGIVRLRNAYIFAGDTRRTDKDLRFNEYDNKCSRTLS